MRKLEESLQFLQKKEENLRFWGVDSSDDPKISEELVREAGCGWIAGGISGQVVQRRRFRPKSPSPLCCWLRFGADWHIRSIRAARIAGN